MNKSHKTTIGGQAVLEGIMMRGPDKAVCVVRDSKGELQTKEFDVKPPRKKTHVLAWPFIRGLIGFGGSMKLGMKALNYSADVFAQEEDEKPMSKTAQAVTTAIAMILGFVLAIAMFTVLPTLLIGWLQDWLSFGTLARSIIEGFLRIVIFFLYLVLVSYIKDIKRVFAYHGAEHMEIAT